MAIATKIGIPADPSDPAHIEAARQATIEAEWTGDFRTYFNNAWWPHPMLHGRYPDALAENLPEFLTAIPAGDMEEIHQPLDFFGFNYYFGMIVEPCAEHGWKVLLWISRK